MEAAYRLCLERERDRERKWQLTKQGAFESSFVHFDFEAEAARERPASWLSDRGKGARQIRACDPVPQKPTRHQLLNRAQMRLSRHLPECMKVFWLVIKNGSNRKESIWQIMKSMPKELPSGKRQKRSTIHNSKKS